MRGSDPFAGSARLREIINTLWTTYDRAEWTLKTDRIPLGALREWMESSDIEILGFVNSTIHGGKFRIEPDLPVEEYIAFSKHYFERCLRENPNGEWSDSRYTAGHDMVNISASLWGDNEIPPRS